MSVMRVSDGSSAAAEANRQTAPDVVAAYPEFPASAIIGKIASFIADGRMDAELLNMESDHSALSSCIGASASGGRVFTALSSQGMAAVQEPMFIAASLRLPIVAAVADRALPAPANVNPDHTASMAARDSGWIQLFSENPQEVYDNLIQAFKIAEHENVRLPVMVCQDGLNTSHIMENVYIEDDGEIQEYVGKFQTPHSLLHTDTPRTLGAGCGPDYYLEFKANQDQGVENSRRVIKEVGKEFGDRFGRYYGYFESYKMDDAETALILMGSAVGTAKDAVDELRRAGEKVGLLKLRVFRPFPHQELRETLAGVETLAVLDRAMIPGSDGGPLYNEVRSALYDLEKRPRVFPFVYGLGGRDIGIRHFEELLGEIKVNHDKEDETRVETSFVNLRG